MAKLTHILDAIRSRDYAIATESIAQVMQRKIEERLAQERTTLARKLVGEDTEQDREFKRTFGFDKRGQVVFSAPGKLSYADVKEVSPNVVKVEVHGREWRDWKNYDELIDAPGWTAFSVANKAFGGRSQKDVIASLARQGIPAEPWNSVYYGSTGIKVPLKYSKKTSKILFGESRIAEDSSGGRATPGPCSKCGKPAQWYHNRLGKRFCKDHAPNDTMSRILPLKEWDSSERNVRHTCVGCGNLWVGPAYEDECPKCHKRQYDFDEDCGVPHKPGKK